MTDHALTTCSFVQEYKCEEYSERKTIILGQYGRDLTNFNSPNNRQETMFKLLYIEIT